MAGDDTKNFLTSARDVVDQTARAFERRDDLASTYNDWLADQGVDLSTFDFHDLERSLVDNDVIAAADDSTVTIGWGRQLHAGSRWEVMMFDEIASTHLGGMLDDAGFDPVVRPFTLESDPWINYNTEKRSYTYPAFMGADGARDYRVTSPENSRRLDAHEVTLGADELAALEEAYDTDLADAATLPEFHRRLDQTGAVDRDEVPDFRAVYNDVLQGLVDSGVRPDNVLVQPQEDEDIPTDRVLKLEHDHGPWYSGTHDGEDVTRHIDKVKEDAVLPAREGYNFVVLPMTASPNLVYTLRDGVPADDKFAPSTALDLEQRIVDEVGMDTYPIADIGAPSVDDGDVVVPDEAADSLLDTKVAKRVTGPGHYDFDTAVVSVYLTPEQRERVDEALPEAYERAGVYDGGDVDLPTVATAMTEAMYQAAAETEVGLPQQH